MKPFVPSYNTALKMMSDNIRPRKNSNPRHAAKPRQKPAPKKLTERYLRNAGEYYLNRYPASSDHFITVMTRKIDRSNRAHPDQTPERDRWIAYVRETLVPQFTGAGFLNDALYARGLFESYKRRGLSARVIRGRIAQKGIPGDMIDTLADDDESGADDRHLVVAFARKKKIGRFRDRSKPYEDKEKRRDLGRLARAGFAYDLAMSVMRDGAEE